MGKVSLKKKLASKLLGFDIDQLVLETFEIGMYEGASKVVDDIIRDLLHDPIVLMEVEPELLQRIIEIIED